MRHLFSKLCQTLREQWQPINPNFHRLNPNAIFDKSVTVPNKKAYINEVTYYKYKIFDKPPEEIIWYETSIGEEHSVNFAPSVLGLE